MQDHGRSRSNRRSGTQIDDQQTIWDHLSWCLLFAIVGVTPWLMGGRNAIGKSVYLALVSLYVICWLVQQCLAKSGGVYRKTGVEWLLGTTAAVVLLTILPLGTDWVERLAPATFELLPAWTADSPANDILGSWNTLSLSPRASQMGLYLLLAHIGLFIVTSQRLRSINDVEMALKTIAAATVLMATFGLLQYLSGTDRFAFVFIHASRLANSRLSGPFTNSNHFTHYLALGVGALIWWWQSQLHEPQRGPTGNHFSSGNGNQNRSAHLYAGVGIAVVMIAGLLANSRGGTLVLIAAVGFCGLILLVARIVRWPMVAATLAVCGIVGIGLGIHGADQVQRDLASLSSVSVETLDHGRSRRHIWDANLQAASMFPLFGTGVGSHAEVYPRFFPHPSTVEYTHAESGYLHVLSENGAVGAVLLGLAIITLVYWCFRALKHAKSVAAGTCAMAVSAGILVTLLHSIWDFPWYLAGTMAPAIVLAACANRLSREHTSQAVCQVPVVAPTPRSHWAVATGLVAAAACGILIQYLPSASAAVSWERYKRLSLSEEDTRENSDDLGPEELQALEQRRYAQLQQMTRLLGRTLQADAHHYRAHLRMASVLMKAFEMQQRYQPNAMAIDQIRDAAISSQFASSEEYATWLERAVGPSISVLKQARSHLVFGIRGLPLTGRAYFRLADLAFLPPEVTAPGDILIEQSQMVRPFDGEVLFKLGRNAALKGDPVTALDFWKQAFHQDDQYREAIVKTVGRRMPADAFVQHFTPDRFQLNELFRFYQDSGAEISAKLIAPELAEMLAEAAENSLGTKAARLWLNAAGVYRYAGESEAALEMAQSAVDATPNHFDTRLAYAKHLLAAGQYENAAEAYTWCLKRRRHDATAKEGLEQAERLLRSGLTSAVPIQTAQHPTPNRPSSR